ncbi:MAG: aldo/keto reductase [Thermoanaerobaculales bacterium]|nr:aldo/keto reductase [Thermoanaerobaculales bacterium]
MDEKNRIAAGNLSRRGFLAVGSAAAAATALPVGAGEGDEEKPRGIVQWRRLGRTGFRASDVSAGAGASDSNLVRYAYDLGINYFDTAESYGNGEHERVIGGAMEHMDRKKIFITTKLEIKAEDTEQTILDRYAKCLERLKTSYADALYMHAVSSADVVTNEHFHAAIKKLKEDGRVKHAGVSCHGPRGEEGDSMEKVLLAAVNDGRFDLMLLSYNFMNKDEAERVLAACKKADIGTTAMKTAPGAVELPSWDPKNPTGDLLKYIERKEKEGQERAKSIEEIEGWLASQKEAYEQTKEFRDKHGITSVAGLRVAAAKWVLQNPNMHTVCLGMRDFEQVDRFVALSGSRMQVAEARFIDDYRVAYSSSYCRHGCTDCLSQCSEHLPVSTIMRYAYYFSGQGREKEAMSKYARLAHGNGSTCMSCNAPCTGACPHGLDIRANLITAHSLLTIA